MRKSVTLLLWLKIFYCIYGVFIFSRFTFLGDSETYLSSPLVFSIGVLFNNTLLVSYLTAQLKFFLFFDLFVHFVYLFFTFYSILKLLNRLKLSANVELCLVLILCFPSFAMWTSVVSKESLTVFFSSFIIIWFIDLIERSKFTYSIYWYLFCLYFVFILRPTVGIGILLAILAQVFINFKYINKYIKFFILIFTIFIGGIISYFLTSEFIQNDFLPLAVEYFNPQQFDSQSTRSGDFWNSEFDFFLKAPYGIFLANLGPTFIETINKPQFIPYFVEGMFFWGLVFYFLLSNFIKFCVRKKVSPNFLIFLIFLLGLILFVNYPFGVFNPGSATRYRSSYFHIIVTLFFYFKYSRKV